MMGYTYWECDECGHEENHIKHKDECPECGGTVWRYLVDTSRTQRTC